eukprot:XP_011677898.1 PREDICTED: uncharacterized protein LOC105444841 [Strongylocentrotus purpuratus]
MHRPWHNGVLLIGVFLTLPFLLEASSICSQTRSQQETASMRGTKSLVVATSYRCYWFWSCTTYKTVTAYRVTYRQVTKYFTTRVCCEGYLWHPAQSKCLRISGPEETLYTTTENPSLNQSLSPGSSLPNNSSSPNRTVLVVLPRTTKLPASSNPPITTTTPSNGKDQAMVAPSRAGRQAIIMISILLFFIAVIVVSIVLKAWCTDDGELAEYKGKVMSECDCKSRQWFHVKL